MQITTETFLQYCLHRTPFSIFTFWLGAVASPLQKRAPYSCRPQMLVKDGGAPRQHVAVCCLHVDSSFPRQECRTVFFTPPNWFSAAVSLRSVQTERWPTSRRWTGRILPWSPVCSIAGRCDICSRSAWNRSATGRWPCYRLQGETWCVTGLTRFSPTEGRSARQLLFLKSILWTFSFPERRQAED